MQTHLCAFLAVVTFAIPVFAAPTIEPASAVLSTSSSISHDGLERTYRIYVPDGDGPFPLVIVLHPLRSTGINMERYTRFSKLAQKENFIVVYPNAILNHWNDRAYNPISVDDVGFIAALLDHIEVNFPVDAARVYVTGASNGGTMANRLACDLGDRFAAVAPVIAEIPYLVQLHAAEAQPIPVLMINGTEDPLIRFSIIPERDSKVGIVTAKQTAAFWATNNGCTPTPAETLLPDRDPEDGTRIEKRAYTAGSAGAELIFYVVKGGGHTWPGASVRNASTGLFGKTSQDMDATKVIWKFFKRHARAN
jgi:polyhydroxybutyrate depolymerase